MAAGRGSKVEWTDYKLIQETISKVLGVGTGSFGYGQTVSSSPVTQFQKITETQWNQVRTDILRCRMHQTGVDYSNSLTQATTDVKIRETDRLAYLNMAQLSEANSLVVASTQASRATIVKSIYEDNWYTSVGLTQIIDFGSYDNARYFFNAGGQIEISSSRSGGTSPSPKNSTWSTMLSTMGSVIFNYTSTTRTGSSGSGSAYGFYDLTTSDVKIFEQNAPVGGSYSSNKYVINAKTNAAGSQVIFTIQYLDLATYTNTTVFGPGLGPYGIDEYVDGTLTSEIKTYRATAPDNIISVTVQQPNALTSDNWSVIEGGAGSTTAPSVVVAPSSISNPQVEVSYSQTFTATGGTAPYTWSYTGTLPAGLSLASATGVLSGMPSTASGYSFAIYASDSTGFVGSKSYTVTVSRPTITITPSSLTNPKVGTVYGVSFTATGGTGPYSWQSSGTIPPGLSLSTGGVLSGNPTSSGTYSFTVQVFDRYAAPGSRSYSVTVASASSISISPTSISGLQVGYDYTQTFSASGGTAPYLWTSSGGLPSGLLLSSSGVLSGRPTTQTSYNFNITATDNSPGAYSRTNNYSVTVAAPDLPPVPTITVSPSSAGSMAVDNSYGLQYSASGGTAPYNFSLVGTLPTGVGLSSGGYVSGTPSSGSGGRTFTYGIRATDSKGYAGTRDVSIYVSAAPPPSTYISPSSSSTTVSYGDTWSTASSGSVGFQVVCSSSYGLVNLSGSSSTGGSPNLNVDEFSISSGNQRTVLMNWTHPPAYSTNPMRFSVSANTGGSFSYTVNRVYVGISYPATGAYSGFQLNTNYGYYLTGTGGSAPYAFNLHSGSLPPGWYLSGNFLGGNTPTGGGAQTYIFTIRVTDGNGIAGYGTYRLTYP